MLLKRYLMFVVFLLQGSTIALADDDTEATDDVYSEVKEQQLMLPGRIQSSLPETPFNELYSRLGFNRFDLSVKTSDPNVPAVEQWCNKAVKDTQTRRSAIDGETGDAVVTLKAKMKRCSQVFKHDLVVEHQCKSKSTKKGKRYIECTVKANITIYKFKADQSSGSLRYVLDQTFGIGGQLSKEEKSTSSSSISKSNPPAKARERAILSASRGAGKFLKRKLLDIKEFQSRAPVIRAKSGWAFTCLSRDIVDLDTPFYVVVNTPEGEKRTGFVKARRIFDGCTETPSQAAARSEGKQIENKPMEAEIILGGGSIKPGHTTWEMPSIGLNIGLFGGITGTIGFFESGNLGPGGGLTVEWNLAPYIGISEFHTFMDFSMLGIQDAAPIRRFFISSMGQSWDSIIPTDLDVLLAMQASLGALKRFYLAGPLFMEASLAFSFSAYSLDEFELPGGDKIKPGVIGLGGMGLVGIGFQIAPRWLLRLRAFVTS